MYYQKYQKYKTKYLNLKGGDPTDIPIELIKLKDNVINAYKLDIVNKETLLN